MGEYVIFAIDNDDNVHINAKFLRYVDERQVMGKMKGKMKLCIGSYLSLIHISEPTRPY